MKDLPSGASVSANRVVRVAPSQFRVTAQFVCVQLAHVQPGKATDAVTAVKERGEAYEVNPQSTRVMLAFMLKVVPLTDGHGAAAHAPDWQVCPVGHATQSCALLPHTASAVPA